MSETRTFPKVSVVIPTYNRAATLRRAILSVLNQEYEDLELIVVDDASTDTTATVLSQIEDSRLKVIRHTENRGGGAARNTGINSATGELVAFQDSDDEWLWGKLEKQVSEFMKNPHDTVLVYCTKIFYGQDHKRLRGARRVVCVPNADEKQLSGDFRKEIQFRSNISTQTILASKKALQEIGGFDTRLKSSQDWDLVVRLSELGKFKYVDEPLVNAYYQQDSISRISQNSIYSLLIIYNKMKRKGLSVSAQANRYARLGYAMGRLGHPARANKLLLSALVARPFDFGIWLRLILNSFSSLVRRGG